MLNSKSSELGKVHVINVSLYKLDTEWYLSNVILFSQLFCDIVEKHRLRGEKGNSNWKEYKL